MSAKAAQRVKEIVEELSEIRLADLSNTAKSQATLSELDASLEEVRGFAQMIQNVLSSVPITLPRRGRPPAKKAGARATPVRATRKKAATRKAAAPRAAAPRVAARRGRRGPGEFNATPFILDCVEKAGSTGIRPREIVEMVQVAAPGKHVRPSALVSTILTRLKKRGAVKRRTGKWYPK